MTRTRSSPPRRRVSGGLNGLVNNVGVVRGGMLDSLDRAVWDATIADRPLVGVLREPGRVPAAAGARRGHREHVVAHRARARAGCRRVQRGESGRPVAHPAPRGRVGAARHPSERGRAGPDPRDAADADRWGRRLAARAAGRGRPAPARRHARRRRRRGAVPALRPARYVTGQMVVVDGGLGLAVQTMLPV